MKKLNRYQYDINSALTVEYYVDQINGDDSNPGTESKPFKTLDEIFINRLEKYTGVVEINLLSDYLLERILTVPNDNILVKLNISHNKLTSKITNDGTHRSVPGFHLIHHNNVFYISLTPNGKIDIVDDGSGLPLFPNSQGFLNLFYHNTLSVDIEIVNAIGSGNSYTEPTIKVDAGSFITTLCWSPGQQSISQIKYTHRKWSGDNNPWITFNMSNNAKFLSIGNKSTTQFVFDLMSADVKDENGNSLSPSDIVSGIVYDADNKPRNIVSNIIF